MNVWAALAAPGYKRRRKHQGSCSLGTTLLTLTFPASLMDFLAPLRHLRYRPSMLIGGSAGIAAGIVCHMVLPETSALLVGWSAGVAVYLAYVVWVAGRANVADIQKRADLLDEGGLAILVITVGAAIASLGAIFVELAKAKASAHSGADVVLAGVTVVLSWMFIHAVFAFHYAHQFYNDDQSEGCLDFPSTECPTYWDFIYFSFVIGMTAQVADVQTKTVDVRKLVLAHGVIAFFFNTAVLALGVNLAASLAS